jgi:acetyltransferase-like isoleucine patch superfamily enzyme
MRSPKVKFDPTARIFGYLDIEEPIGIESNAIVSRSSIGAYSFIGKNSEVWNASIGRYCSIGPGCRIGPGNHPTDRLTTSSISYSDYFDFYINNAPILSEFETREPIIIGHDVWVGAGSTITNGVHIGDGAIIAAHAVVTKDVAPYAIVGGVPAKFIRGRFDERTIERLRRLGWWNYDIASWGARGDLGRLQSLSEGLIDGIERAVEQQEPPKIVGRRFRATFVGSTPSIEPIEDL